MDTDDQRKASANPGFALGQLLKALATGAEHGDEATRERAAEKARSWLATLRGMASGALRIGARKPIREIPVWATPQVVYGGFVTGRLLAGGKLLPHEVRLRERLGVGGRRGKNRLELNRHWLTPHGLADLLGTIDSGHYRFGVPEEAALAVVTWLLRKGDTDAAKAIVTEIRPYFDRLRFYPEPADAPRRDSEDVFVHSVGDVRTRLEAVRLPGQIARERETLLVWLPLYDRLVSLFAETVDGDAPLRMPDGTIEGGWPCQRYTEDWANRARDLVDEIRETVDRHRLCRWPERPNRYFPRLRRHLSICIVDPAGLTGADVGEIRGIIADIHRKRGLPGSDRCRALREGQAARATSPTAPDFAKLLLDRMRGLAGEDGLAPERIERILAPDGDRPIPEPLRTKVESCLFAPVESLIDAGVIASGETLATVVPPISARTRASAFADPVLRGMYRELYESFRRRRSLLLLNLESQVRFEELPWVAAIEAYRREGHSERQTARELLTRIAILSLTSFPETILPNRLLREIDALSREAGLGLPITDELAADIFMGAFTGKYVRAAQDAATMLRGSLYETYYDIDFDRVARMTVPRGAEKRPAVSKPFFRLCEERTERSEEPSGSSVAINGTIIEQQQILTTHNLATLFTALGLGESLAGRLDGMARDCFAWICRSLEMPVDGWRPRLRRIKRAAYAWRQMMFFLALREPDEQREFSAWAREFLTGRPRWLAAEVGPALAGLEWAAEGRRLPAGDPKVRRFLGWTTGGHWLMLDSRTFDDR